jgi:hypothetical protein
MTTLRAWQITKGVRSLCGGIGLNKILLFFSSFYSVLATFYDVVPVSSFK